MKFAGPGLPIRLDGFHAGKRRAAFAPLKHTCERIPIAFKESFDAAVAEVANPTREPEALRLLHGRVPESHALNEAGNDDGQAPRSVHRLATLLTHFNRRTFSMRSRYPASAMQTAASQAAIATSGYALSMAGCSSPINDRDSDAAIKLHVAT